MSEIVTSLSDVYRHIVHKIQINIKYTKKKNIIKRDDKSKIISSARWGGEISVNKKKIGFLYFEF